MNIKHINIGLAITACFLLIYYVVQANAMAAQTWRAKDLQERLSILRNERNELVAQQSALDDREHLLTLVRAAGMVPAGAVVYLVQDRSVAAR